MSHAVDLLSRRDHAEAELARKLRRTVDDEEEIARIVARLRELGYLDDRRLAVRIVEAALAGGRMAGARLRLELQRRGIPRAIADEVLHAAAGDYDERGAVTALLSRKFPRFAAEGGDPREKRRIVGWLQRRGFSLSAILEALREPAED
ncbi:regulatory protein RecX [Geobacter pickeringii]|uniref:regulatory protein RecX n=1 Tax=Geobacter pickeringii TaxID=345632 RepID=UPI000A53128F|nr:regulatory protein RecX [Geobacter pickeringii]